MNSFRRLSEITGYELDKLGEILVLNTPIEPEQEVTPLQLMRLCEKSHKYITNSTYILVSDNNQLFRGVVLERVNEKWYNNYGWHSKEIITIAYKGSGGKREIVNIEPSGSSSYYYCFQKQSIRAYPNELVHYGAVSVGHNTNGYFFMDQNNSRISVFFDRVHRDPTGCFIIEKDSFWGLANSSGRVILNPLYCKINPFSEGLAAILSYKLWGFVNTEGNIIVAPQYMTVEAFNNGVSKVSVHGDKFGFINKEGNGVIINDSYIEFPEYCFITQESDSFYGRLHRDDKNAGALKKFSIPLLSLKLKLRNQGACDYMFIGDCLVEKKDGHKFLLSYYGDSSNEIDDCEILGYSHKFNVKSQKFDGPIVRHIEITDLPFYYLVSRGNNKGVINNSGDIIVPIEYEYIGLLSSQVILASNCAGMRLFSTNPKLNLSRSGESYTQSYELIVKKEESYDSKAELNQFYVYKTNKVGFIVFEDGVFKTLFPCVYDYIDYHYYSTYHNENRHVGSFIIDGLSTNRRILGSDGVLIDKPQDIAWMTDYSYSGIAVALKDSLFGLIDSKQKVLRDYSYDTIFKLDAFHYLLSKNDHVELVRFNRNYEASVIKEFSGAVISRLSPFVFRILRSGKYFILKYNEENENLLELLEHGFDKVYGIDESFIVVEENGLSGCYDNEGRKLLDIKYESIVTFKNNKTHYKKDSPIQLTINKIVVGCYPIDTNGVFICDLFNIESRNLIHIYKSWLTNSSAKDNRFGNSGIIHPEYLFEVKYVDEYHPHLGAYILLNNHSKKIFISSLECQRFEGPFDKIEPFYNSGNYWERSFQGLTTRCNGKRGLIRLKPFDVIPCVFDHPVYFVDRSSRFWIIEKSAGEESKKSVYDSINKRELDLGNIASVILAAEDIYKVSVLTEDGEQKSGLVDNSFKQIVPLTFDSITQGNREEGQFIVYKENSGYGIIDKTGNYIYPLSPGRISYQGLWGERRGSYSFYDENDVLSAVSEDGYIINDVIDGAEKEYLTNSKNHYILDKEESGRFSVCTSFGEKYTDIEETYTENDVTILKTKDGFFAINKQKRITPSFHEAITINKRLRYLSVKDNRRRQFVDFEGELLGEIEGLFSGCFLYKEAGVITTINKKEDGRLYYKLLSLDGDEIVDTEFSFIGSFHENYATCVINSEQPIDKAFFKGTKEESFFAFNRKNYGQWGIINNKGEIVIPLKFDFIRPVKDGQTIYVKDRKYGLINLKDKYRTAPCFKFLFSFSEGLCAFREFADEGDGGWHYQYSNCGLINEKGKIVVPAAYAKIYAFKDGIANVVSRSNYLNQIDREGNLLNEWKELPSREEPYDDYDSGYSQADLDDMYRAAFEGDPSAQWNID